MQFIHLCFIQHHNLKRFKNILSNMDWPRRFSTVPYPMEKAQFGVLGTAMRTGVTVALSSPKIWTLSPVLPHPSCVTGCYQSLISFYTTSSLEFILFQGNHSPPQFLTLQQLKELHPTSAPATVHLLLSPASTALISSPLTVLPGAHHTVPYLVP